MLKKTLKYFDIAEFPGNTILNFRLLIYNQLSH